MTRSAPAWFSVTCTCGDSMDGSVSPSSKAPQLIAVFEEVHHGDGHTTTTASATADGQAAPMAATTHGDRQRG